MGRHSPKPSPASIQAVRSIWHIKRADAAGAKIGHLGFFRATFHDTLWPKATKWLLATDSA